MRYSKKTEQKKCSGVKSSSTNYTIYEYVTHQTSQNNKKCILGRIERKSKDFISEDSLSSFLTIVFPI